MKKGKIWNTTTWNQRHSASNNITVKFTLIPRHTTTFKFVEDIQHGIERKYRLFETADN